MNAARWRAVRILIAVQSATLWWVAWAVYAIRGTEGRGW